MPPNVGNIANFPKFQSKISTRQITLGVNLQVCRDRDPQCLLAPLQQVLYQAARDLSALAHPRAVSDEEAASFPLLLCFVALARIQHRLELQR